MRTIQIEIDGRSYLWNGRQWTNERFLQPPVSVRHRLTRNLIRHLRELPDEELDAALVMDAARNVCDAGDLEEARTLAQRVLRSDPRDADAVEVLADILRKERRPREALELTESFQRRKHAGVLTVRAAAFCDVEEWDRAHTMVRRAMAVLKEREEESPATDRVMARLMSARLRTAA